MALNCYYRSAARCPAVRALQWTWTVCAVVCVVWAKISMLQGTACQERYCSSTRKHSQYLPTDSAPWRPRSVSGPHFDVVWTLVAVTEARNPRLRDLIVSYCRRETSYYIARWWQMTTGGSFYIVYGLCLFVLSQVLLVYIPDARWRRTPWYLLASVVPSDFSIRISFAWLARLHYSKCSVSCIPIHGVIMGLAWVKRMC